MIMDYSEFISERIAQLRTQRDVAARDMSLSIGQSQNYINMIENKKAMPSMQAFFFICEYFEISPHDFFDEESKNPKELNYLIEILKQLDSKDIESLTNVAEKMKK